MEYHILDKTFTEEEVESIKKEMISKVDTDMLLELFKYTIKPHNSGYNQPNLDKVDDKAVDVWCNLWASKKWKFYVILGRNLNYRVETQINWDDEFKDKLDEIFRSQYMKRKKNGEFVEISTKHFKYYRPIIDLFQIPVLKNNICPDDEFIQSLIESYKPRQKLSRFFSLFFNDENFDIAYSKLFQNKVKGIFANISIDPIDFLLISISSHFDYSCYHLKEFYNAAGYSFMSDNTSLILFASKEEKAKFELFGNRLAYDKINRIVLDWDENYGQMCFDGQVIDSSHQFVTTYVEELTKLINGFSNTKIEYHQEGNSVIVSDQRYHHICDNKGECFIANLPTAKKHEINPGNKEMPRISDVKKTVPTSPGLKGWMW